MQQELQRESELLDSDSTDWMVHLEASPEGCNIALCGAKLRGIDADHQELDCVVCAEMADAEGSWY